MLVTCNINQCLYYDKGFCGKPVLNIIGGTCGTISNKRQIYYDIFKPEFKNLINIIEVSENEIKNITREEGREEAAGCDGEQPAKPHEQEIETTDAEEESAIKEDDKENISKNDQ